MVFIDPTPALASTIEGEKCLIWWVDKSVDGWPLITTTDVDSCPKSCPAGIAGDINNQSDTWCADLTPPPNLPGVYLGNACSASDSRTVTLLTDGTFGTNFDIQANGQTVNNVTSYTFTNIPEGLFSAVGQAHNSQGASGWSSPITAQHDYTAPTTTPDIVGITHNGYYTSSVSVAFNAIDVGCFGVSQTSYALNGVVNPYTGTPITISDDGVNTLQYRSTDGYHVEDEKSVTIPIDTTPPTLNFILDRPYDVGNWWTAPLNIAIFAEDATSGLASLDYNLNEVGWMSGTVLTLTDGIYSLDAQATDKAGHSTYDGVVIQIDSVAPILNISLDGEQGKNAWFITPPRVSLSASDATSGIAGILYQVENGGQTLYNAPLTFTREGLYTLQAFAVDNAQHITTQTFQVGYDVTAPQTTATLTETEGGMTVTLTGWDAVSGVSNIRMAINGVWQDYHHPITLTETGEYWVQFFSSDFAGHVEAEKITHFTIADEEMVIVQAPPVVASVPPANPPNTPPFETDDDFPPNLGTENTYFVSLNENLPRLTSENQNQQVSSGDNAGDSSPSEAMIQREGIKYIPRPILDENGLPFVQAVPKPNVVYANSPNIIDTLRELDAPQELTAPMTIQTLPTPITANPLSGALATLATLGIITAGAGAMTMTATAIAKKREQEEAKSAQLATFQAQQSAQAQTAQVNWDMNQTMQANASQAVVSGVMQSQANANFWSAYADWQEKATQAEAKRTIKNMIGDVLNDVQATVFYQNLLGITSLVKLAVALVLLLFTVNGIQISDQYAEDVVADIPTNSCDDLPEMANTSNSVWCIGRNNPGNVLGRGGSPSTGIRGNKTSPAENFFNTVYNEPAVIYNYKFSGHAIDQMYNRGIPPSAVLDTVQNGIHYHQPGRTTSAFYSQYNNMTVVTSREGMIVTVHYGRPPSGSIPNIGLSE